MVTGYLPTDMDRKLLAIILAIFLTYMLTSISREVCRTMNEGPTKNTEKNPLGRVSIKKKSVYTKLFCNVVITINILFFSSLLLPPIILYIQIDTLTLGKFSFVYYKVYIDI